MSCEKDWFIGSFSDCRKLNGKCETGDLVLTWFWKMPGSIGGCKGRMQMCLSRDTCCFLGSCRGSGTSGWKWKIRRRLFERPLCFYSSLEARWDKPTAFKIATEPGIWAIESYIRGTNFEKLIPTHGKIEDNRIFIFACAVSLTERVKHKPVKVHT